MACRFEKLWCFAYQVFALYKDFADTGCLYSKRPTLSTFLCILGVRCSLRTLLVKAVTSIAEKLLEKVLTFFCGFR